MPMSGRRVDKNREIKHFVYVRWRQTTKSREENEKDAFYNYIAFLNFYFYFPFFTYGK